ncbi:CoA ester lyase [Sphingobium sp. DEHP117]|uniref:HpcH/HpaI aldolase/citrate lyase family protein n=1 Tax=Sphingobium sp. DEHP117 TaxID=2993436 RepID=UPI0027D4EA64|nr:aldolase/citrate lyase family protein [Sphingobium sp. DEHP117]MDQ4419732.1 CoA ester lyase [Sphingobium sp. DEHP117]
MHLHHARSLLFLPASNVRAIDKARGLPCDMVILDLEDAVAEENKPAARAALAPALGQGFGGRLVAVRVNAVDSPHHSADIAALAGLTPGFVVLPKVEAAAQAAQVHRATGRPVIAMIESPRGVVEAQAIAAEVGVAALFMGNNDLRHDLRIPLDADRSGLMLGLQSVILAARLSDKAVFDGVYNKLDDAPGFTAECHEGRALGFDGKTLIHPNQIEPANTIFGPSERELADARALIAAHTGGAERHQGAMIEDMHVAQARSLLERAGQA